MRARVCVCVCVCARTCMRAYVHVYVEMYLLICLHSIKQISSVKIHPSGDDDSSQAITHKTCTWK